jgi:acetylornithine deacetylase/succinyl-diaminopimelate desuccinylase-like protein
MARTADVLDRIDAQLQKSMDRLFDLIRFPTIATDPAFDRDCRKAAAWLKDYFSAMEFTCSLHETTGQPVVIAEYAPEGLAPHAPHVLFYGHYDVQPADPLDLWTHPPFDPAVVKGKNGKDRIFARGAADDKGQFMTFTEAVRAWLDVHGRLPFRLTMLIEGDEEGDSSHLDRFLAASRSWLKPDIAFVCDTDMWDERTPAISTFLRGCIAEEVTITGPRIDLHSGYYGGPARNPIKVLSSILGAIHDKNGRVTIPGFYDGVKAPSAELRRQWKKLGFDAREFLGSVGMAVPAGEKGFTALEQTWARPTAEFNGILGGYTGAGSKTVLPAKAMAKLTFRLVAGQNPRKVRKAFRDFVKARLPADCKVSFISQGGDSTGIHVAEDSPWISAAAQALELEWGVPAARIGSGGSIPVVQGFRDHLKVDSLMVGFGRDDDAVHSPNEKYDVECYHRGQRSWARIIAAVAKEMNLE